MQDSFVGCKPVILWKFRRIDELYESRGDVGLSVIEE